MLCDRLLLPHFWNRNQQESDPSSLWVVFHFFTRTEKHCGDKPQNQERYAHARGMRERLWAWYLIKRHIWGFVFPAGSECRRIWKKKKNCTELASVPQSPEGPVRWPPPAAGRHCSGRPLWISAVLLRTHSASLYTGCSCGKNNPIKTDTEELAAFQSRFQNILSN